MYLFSSLKHESHLPPLLLRHHVPSYPASCPAPLAVAAGLPGPQGELPAQYEPGNAQVASCGHPERGRPGHHGQAHHVGAVAPGGGEGVEGAANQEGLWDKEFFVPVRFDSALLKTLHNSVADRKSCKALQKVLFQNHLCTQCKHDIVCCSLTTSIPRLPWVLLVSNCLFPACPLSPLETVLRHQFVFCQSACLFYGRPQVTFISFLLFDLSGKIGDFSPPPPQQEKSDR